MKRFWRQIIFLLFLLPLVCIWAYAAVIPGIVVSNKVTTGNTANTHAVADTSELHGGFMQLQYSSELRDIPESRRKRGMLAYSHDTRSIYQLYSSPGHHWQRYNSGGGIPVDITGKVDKAHFSAYSAGVDVKKLDVRRFLNYSATRAAAQQGPKGDRGYDGRMGKTLTCSILDGTRAVTYDNAGLNPSPSTLDPYSAWLWEDGTLITEPHSYLTIFYEWFVPVNSHLTYPAFEVDGMQVRRQVFEPGVLSNYSAGKNDYVKVFARLSSSRFPFGSRPCDASVPVAVLKQGPKGLQGDVAQAVVSAPVVLGAFSSARIPSPLVLTPYSSTVAPLRINDAAGNVKVYIDGLGYQHFRDANNYDVVRVQTDGIIAILKNNVEWLRVDGQTKQVKVIRNGSAVFEIYSTGKYKGPEGWSTNVSKTRNYTLANGFRGYTTGGSGGSATLPNPYTLPVAGQSYRSPSGTVRHTVYTSGRQTVRGSLTIY